MEGRGPVPPASHPYPDNINLNKFWGSKTVWGVLKASIVMIAIPSVVIAIKYYLRRNEMPEYTSLSKEEYQKRSNIAESFEEGRWKARLFDLKIKIANDTNDRAALMDKDFDGGKVIFIPPIRD